MAVELDADQDMVLRSVWAAADAGLVINRDGARNQLEGAIIHAARMTLKEQVTLDGNGITSLDWDQYPIMTFSEVPEIDVVIFDNSGMPTLGMGGVCAFGPTTAAIGNAVAHPLGVRIQGHAVDAGEDRGGVGRLGTGYPRPFVLPPPHALSPDPDVTVSPSLDQRRLGRAMRRRRAVPSRGSCRTPFPRS